MIKAVVLSDLFARFVIGTKLLLISCSALMGPDTLTLGILWCFPLTLTILVVDTYRNVGATWVFQFNGSSYEQVGEKLVGTGYDHSLAYTYIRQGKKGNL